jgi:hypothetical protein
MAIIAANKIEYRRAIKSGFEVEKGSSPHLFELFSALSVQNLLYSSLKLGRCRIGVRG